MRFARKVLPGILIAVALCSAGYAWSATTRPADGPEAKASSLEFIVQDVFYIKPPVDRVILVGIVRLGVVRVGDRLVVHTSAGPVNVAVDHIESFEELDPKQAVKGQQVGLRVTGIRKDQPDRGDRVTAASD